MCRKKEIEREAECVCVRENKSEREGRRERGFILILGQLKREQEKQHREKGCVTLREKERESKKERF